MSSHPKRNFFVIFFEYGPMNHTCIRTFALLILSQYLR